MRKEIINFRKSTGNPPLIGYLPSLFPNSKIYGRILEASADSGLKFIEAGIPFENPYLDGEIISTALTSLIGWDNDPGRYIKDSGNIISSKGLEGIAMLYNETLEKTGIDTVINTCVESGFKALLVPNISQKNMITLGRNSSSRDLEIVSFVSEKHTENEIDRILEATTGFIYLQSTCGKTGGQFKPGGEIRKRLSLVKKKAEKHDLPVCLGFGINYPEDAEQASKIGADGIIVGTSFLKAAQSGRDHFMKYIEGFLPFMEDAACAH